MSILWLYLSVLARLTNLSPTTMSNARASNTVCNGLSHGRSLYFVALLQVLRHEAGADIDYARLTCFKRSHT